MKNFEQVCRLVRQGLDDGAYPSACLSVGIRGSVCVRQTFGPARETTLYDIASLSKIVGTTMIAFRFLEEGRLRLYDTVEQFFPAPEDKKGITVLQLMTHTSGLPAHFYLSDVERGLLDASVQVGQTGHTIAPDLYIALGISGQIQHVAALAGAKKVIAVNRDASAPIFQVADYGWVGDIEEALPVLLQTFKTCAG